MASRSAAPVVYIVMSSRIAKIAGHISPSNSVSTSRTGGQSKRPIKVVVTGAAGNIGYVLCFLIGNGRLLGPDQPIELRLLEIPPMKAKLRGVAMELGDGAFPCIKKLVPTVDAKTAFEGVEIALLVGAMPRKKGMLRADLLKKNAGIFKAQGAALNKYADRNVKVLVVGNPANTNAIVASTFAPDLPQRNFTAMTRLDQNRAMSMLSGRLSCDSASLKNIVIWGNHSKTMYPDVNQGYVMGPFGGKTPIREAVDDNKWLNSTFIKMVQQRGSEIIKARGASSAASAANAACDHIRDWFLGTRPGEWVAMAVPSDGSYGVPKGIVYSFPCTCKNFEYKIVQGLSIDSMSQRLMTNTAEELLREKQDALS